MRSLAPKPARSERLALGALALFALFAGCAKRPARDNLVLVVIDTLRADHLSCYGYPRETTPNLDRLAAEGLRFTHAQAPRAKTTPSVGTLLTGLYPHDHGIRDLTQALAPGVPTLAGELARAGWRTQALVGNYVLQRERSGLDRGFDGWIEEFPQKQGVPPDEVPQRTARSLTDGALEWLAAAGAIDSGDARSLGGATEPSTANGRTRPLDADEPFFLYLHYMDPHGLYDAPDEHRLFEAVEPRPIPPADDEPGAPRTRIATYNVPTDAWLPGGRVDEAKVVARYDAEVRYVDAELGRLFDALERSGRLDDSWIVVVADHGESLGEHRYWFEHGVYAYEATCRVPLIVVPPRRLAARPTAGVRDSDISLADLRPTLTRWLGVRATAASGGSARRRGPVGLDRSALLHGEAPGRHPVFSEKVDRSERSRAVQTKAVRIGDHKLLRRYLPTAEAGQFRVLEELYELAGDPREERNLVTLGPLDDSVPYEALSAALDEFVRADEDFDELARILQRERETLGREDPEALRILQALGY